MRLNATQANNNQECVQNLSLTPRFSGVLRAPGGKKLF